VDASNIRAVWSRLAVATRRPSGEKTALLASAGACDGRAVGHHDRRPGEDPARIRRVRPESRGAGALGTALGVGDGEAVEQQPQGFGPEAFPGLADRQGWSAPSISGPRKRNAFSNETSLRSNSS
jgi:hypothetical protein